VEQAQLNLQFTEVKSLVDGMAGIAQVQIGNSVNPTTSSHVGLKINPSGVFLHQRAGVHPLR
jgi:membrane fusion protein (multidrug efflux system)